MRKIVFLLLSCGLLALVSTGSLFKNAADDTAPRRAQILFLGHPGARTHDPTRFAATLAGPLYQRGIGMTYTADTNDLNAENLAKYDGIVIFANINTISPAKEKALKDFVESGKGLIPIHAASATFGNSAWYVSAVGGKFKRHAAANNFKVTNVNTSSPVMQGVTEFSAYDEPYEHSDINPDKTVLQERIDPSGAHEAWTWIRNQGKGRVFYTASGHNDSVWVQPSFQRLVGNGILWAIGDKVNAQVSAFKAPTVRYNDTMIVPNYERRAVAPKYQYALTPEQSMQTMQVGTDFDVKLFAAEPDITNPIAMSWDEKGRLWIVESVDYPNTFLETDGAANDRIKICEDTNGDGKADKFTVFADKLNIPTSIAFANGGVIVSMAPNFIFLKDTNGDDKADIRENLITGWGKSDTHAGPSNLMYGFDNKIWGVVGYSGYGGTIDGTNNGVKPAQAVYSFNPDGKNLEFLAQTTNNTWGLGFTEDNNAFISTANGNHSDFYFMPSRYAQRTLPAALAPVAAAPGAGGPGARGGFGGGNATPRPTVFPFVNIIQGHTDVHTLDPYMRQVDQFGGFTAAAGHHFYTARNFPKKYWNRIAFVNEPTARLVHNAVIVPKGAGFAEEDGWNLMAASDEWVGPVQSEVGPDGAVWVADWYNFIIQHNPNPGAQVSAGKNFTTGQGNAYSTPMRDLERGRIYRVVYKNAKPYTPVKLDKSNVASLLSGLENDNMFWRMTAQRLLVESKNQAAIPGLIKLASDQKVDEIGLNAPAIHAIWTLSGLNALNGSNAPALQAVTKALSHPSPGVRKAAMQALPKNAQTASAIIAAGLTNDKDLNTRMNAFVTLAGLPASADAAKAIYTASLNEDNGKDEWISKAMLAAAVVNESAFLSSSPKVGEIPATQSLTLNQRIVKGLTEEVYNYNIANFGNGQQQAPAPSTPLAINNRAASTKTADPLPISIINKEISIKTTVGPRAAGRPGQQAAAAPAAPAPAVQGFILGQGDKTNGYAVYVEGGKVNFVVNQGGKSYKAVTTDPLPDRYALVTTLAANGDMTIEVDGKKVASAKAPGLFTSSISTPVRSGSDVDKIGSFEDAFTFTGAAQGLSLNLKATK